MSRTRTALLISLAALTFAALGAGCARKADDAQLDTTLKAQLFSDPQTKGSGVQVAVKNGVVTLSGTVPDEGARYEAYKLATNTPGVTKVNDETVLQPPAQPPVQTAEATPPSTPAPEETPAPEPARVKPRERRAARRDRAARKSHSDRRDAHRTNADAEHRDQGQSSTPQESTPPPADAAPPVAAPAPVEATPPPPPPPQPITAIFPAGTTLEIQTIDSVDSAVNHVGDEFQASLAQPLTSAGVVVVPAGANVYLRLTKESVSGQYKGRDVLKLRLARLEFRGKDYSLVSSAYTDAGSSRGKNTAEKVGGGAILGAVIGAIAGGGKGAAIGAGVGGAGGGVYQGVSKPKPLRIPPETKLDFRLDQPLRITYMPHHHESSR